MSYARISLVIIHTAAEWAASSQVLNTYEAGLESDTGLIKRGDGVNFYSALSYLPWGSGGGGPESDPIFIAWLAGPPSLSEFTNDVGFITVESDPAFAAWLAGPPNLSEFTDDVGFITSETDPVFTTWLALNDYLSSSTSSTQSGYFGALLLKDQISPSHYLNITVEDNLTGNRNLQINVADGNKLLTITGNVTGLSGDHSGISSGTNTGDQTSISGISGTKAQFNTANSDGDFVFVGDPITLDYNNVLYNQIFS